MISALDFGMDSMMVSSDVLSLVSAWPLTRPLPQFDYLLQLLLDL